MTATPLAFSSTLDVRVTDTSLRDGSHAKRHQFTEEHVRRIVAGLDAAGMPVIEVTHGDGLGGSSFNYGKSLVDERVLMKAAVDEATQAKIAALMLPGLGTKDDIKAIADIGVSICRVATHCTEADISEQHFALAREIGLETVGFLMMAHTIVAIRAGAVQVDGSTRRFGAGSGNTSCEALAAVAERLGIRTGLDVLKMIDVAEDIVRPVMDEECVLDRMSLIMGYAGVYSSFLKHAYRAAERYGVSGADILLECGNRNLVGGQEDQIIQIAADLAGQ